MSMSDDALGSTLQGLVGASAPGGYRSGAGGSWTLVIHLAAFRLNGSVQQCDLRCEMPMPDQQALGHWMSRLGP